MLALSKLNIGVELAHSRVRDAKPEWAGPAWAGAEPDCGAEVGGGGRVGLARQDGGAQEGLEQVRAKGWRTGFRRSRHRAEVRGVRFLRRSLPE